MDEFTAVHLFKLIKLGIIHPKEAPGTVKGIMIGFWRFEVQFIFGFWNKQVNEQEAIYHA
tara:strand:- start:16068 stop:16247 length:180 start_codon:yes stop_codon:yes gene_type:complete